MSHDLDLVKLVEDELKRARLESDILLAYSGGLDSTCLLHLLLKTRQRPVIAHCNFQLRGEESEEDALFAKGQAMKYGLEFKLKSFDTVAYAQKEGVSIQMAARDLRYAWFRELKSKFGLQAIATGAHLDDQFEGMLIKLGRGSGPAGIAGMSVWNGELFRPLLSTSREELETFAKNQGIHFREDSSNKSDNYLRNSLRHNVIPSWKEEVPELLRQADKSRRWIQEMELFVQAEMHSFFQEHLILNNTNESLNIKVVQEHASPSLLIFYWLQEKGFSSSQMEDIHSALASEESKQFSSGKWVLYKERNALVLTEIFEPSMAEITLQEGDRLLQLDERRYEVSFHEQAPDTYEPGMNYFDADRLVFPLRFRRWKDGDRIQLLGMQGRKKISDVLIDLKVDASKKSSQFLMESDGEVQWLVGHRQAEPSKLTEDTRKLLCFRLLS